MTHRRKFIKTGVLTGLSASLFSSTAVYAAQSGIKKKEYTHWLWVRPKETDNESELQKQYKRFYAAGIRGIFFEEDSEKHYRIAKGEKLQAHRWMWTMNRGEKSCFRSRCDPASPGSLYQSYPNFDPISSPPRGRPVIPFPNTASPPPVPEAAPVSNKVTPRASAGSVAGCAARYSVSHDRNAARAGLGASG